MLNDNKNVNYQSDYDMLNHGVFSKKIQNKLSAVARTNKKISQSHQKRVPVVRATKKEKLEPPKKSRQSLQKRVVRAIKKE